MEYKFSEGQLVVHRSDHAGYVGNDYVGQRVEYSALRRGVILEQVDVAGPAYLVEWQNEQNKGLRQTVSEFWLKVDES